MSNAETPALECDNAITESAIRSTLGFAAVESFAGKLVADGLDKGSLCLDLGASVVIHLTVRNGVAYASRAL